MHYGDHIATSANPRLLILLTDELEESACVVNRIIDQQIIINFDGCVPKNRWFISVIGYNHKVKELCSGWLKDLDTSPLRYETIKKKTPNEAGEDIEHDETYPIWIESVDNKPTGSYKDAINLLIEIVDEWTKDHLLAPIIVDCSEKFHGKDSIDEIVLLKNLSTQEGNTLFFGTYTEQEDIPTFIFSNMPIEWKWRFDIHNLNEKLYIDGLFCREELLPIICAMT